MKLLIKQALIADTQSPYHGQKKDLLVIDGILTEIGDELNLEANQIISIKDLHISCGWVDVFCHFNDPGAEHKETLETGAKAAAAGGFTQVFVLPNTSPCLHSKSQIEYIVQKNRLLPVTVHPIGAITKNTEGKVLAEMYDMQNSGAIAFSDGLHPLQLPQVMLKALQYVKVFNGIVIQIPDEVSISKTGLINEGIVSTQLGLPGKPSIAETLMIARDIALLTYTESRLHITAVSTAAGVELIRQAKQKGLQITCSATPYHLSFCDADLITYDTNLKLNPALRTADDVAALKAAVLDGTIDLITSHHNPQNWDAKTCEFEYAQYGMEGLESCAGAVMQALPNISIDRFIELFSTNAKKIFGLKNKSIAVGNEMDATMFVPHHTYQFGKQQIQSLCSNNAFVGKNLNCKVVGILAKNNIFLNP